MEQCPDRSAILDTKSDLTQKFSWDRCGTADGMGMTDIKAINTETVARSCEDVKKARATGG